MANQDDFNSTDFAIVFHDGARSRIHTGGDRIKGKVVWRAHRDLTVNSIHLQFKGKVKTQATVSTGQSTSTVWGRAILFDYTHTLCQTLRQNIGESRSWEFDLEFPSKALTPTARCDTWKEHPDFHHLPGHELPPTWSGRVDDIQKIYYYVQVVAHTPAVFRRPVKNRFELSFCPYRTVQHPDCQLYKRVSTLVRTSRKLDSALPYQHLSIKDRARNLLGSSNSSEPTSTFSVHSEVPSVAYINGKLPIFISIEHDLAKSTSREIPVIHLVDFHARLTELTKIRAKRYIRKKSTKITIERRQARRPLTERTNIGEMLDLSIREHITPTFTTYSVCKNYMLKVTATVICAEKIFEIELGKHVLLILPGPYRPQAGAEAEVVSETQPALVEESLPRYEEAPAPWGMDADSIKR
ncbi:hypothetical protein MMC14_001188 [Varicellaria rhodocarpa]|nr:hypothetical protein [Varicellaria rhodocarpa]